MDVQSYLDEMGVAYRLPGTHSDAVTMSLAEYRRVAQPEMGYFCRHV